MRNLILALTLIATAGLAVVAAPASPAPPAEPAPTVELETPRLAAAFRAPSYLFLHGDVELLSGVLLRVTPDPGPVLAGVEPLPVGVYLVLDATEAVDSDGVIDLVPGEMLGISGEAVAPGSVSVTCSSGYYACCSCWTNAPGVIPTRAVARCRQPNENPSDCLAGGKGAVSCSIDKATCVEMPEK